MNPFYLYSGRCCRGELHLLPNYFWAQWGALCFPALSTTEEHIAALSARLLTLDNRMYTFYPASFFFFNTPFLHTGFGNFLLLLFYLSTIFLKIQYIYIYFQHTFSLSAYFMPLSLLTFVMGSLNLLIASLGSDRLFSPNFFV